MLREQWVITLALTPLTLLLFGQVSVVGLLANALAIPWVTLVVTPLALPASRCRRCGRRRRGRCRLLRSICSWLAALPFATVSVPAPPLWAGAAGVLGGVLLAMRLPWSLRALGVPLLLPVLLWQAPRPAPGQFELLAADIGQGNAVIVRTAAHTLVYDSGPRYSPESEPATGCWCRCCARWTSGSTSLVLSHRDTDHTGGARGGAGDAAAGGAAQFDSKPSHRTAGCCAAAQRCAGRPALAMGRRAISRCCTRPAADYDAAAEAQRA